jgi:hypothetical protein
VREPRVEEALGGAAGQPARAFLVEVHELSHIVEGDPRAPRRVDALEPERVARRRGHAEARKDGLERHAFVVTPDGEMS